MDQRTRFRHYLYSTPSTGSLKKTRPDSALSTLSVSSADSERTAMRKDVRRLYRSEELPSIYEPGELMLGFRGAGSIYERGEPPIYEPSGEVSAGSGFFDIPITSSAEEKDPKVDWNGESDPANPRNWPMWRAGLNVGCIFLMCIISYVLTVLTHNDRLKR